MVIWEFLHLTCSCLLVGELIKLTIRGKHKGSGTTASPRAMLRRSLAVAPRLARQCSFQAEVKKMEAAATKLAPSLPEGLKEIAEQGVRHSSGFEASQCCTVPARAVAPIILLRPCTSVACESFLRGMPGTTTSSLPLTHRSHFPTSRSPAFRLSLRSLPLSAQSCTSSSFPRSRR